MIDAGSNTWNYVAALFSSEFLSGGVEYDAIERIHRGEIEEWVDALARCGLFDKAVVGDVAATWRGAPHQLFDMLVRDADEMTAKRCALAWSSLDRLAPLARLG